MHTGEPVHALLTNSLFDGAEYLNKRRMVIKRNLKKTRETEGIFKLHNHDSYYVARLP